MNTVPCVPESLEEDFLGWLDLHFRWKEGDGTVREVKIFPTQGTLGAARIELRPFIVVEELDGESLEREKIVAEIPLESLVSIDVDRFEIHPGAIDEGGNMEEVEVTTPVARWVRHPDKGLVRFTAP